MARAQSALLAALLATGLLAAGCRKAAEPPPETGNVVQPAKPPAPPTPRPVEPPKPTVKKVALPVDDEKLSEEEQTREDAEATGMTSRLPAETGPSEPISANADSGTAPN